MSIVKKFLAAAAFCLCSAVFFRFPPFSPAAFARDVPADLGIFSLKDGRFHIGEMEVDIEVNEVPDDVKGPLRFWSVFENDEEIGVWFFSEGGECLTFLPMESAFECRGIVFSPDGERLLAAKGSPTRPIVTWEMYETGPMERRAEFTGLSEGAGWIDEARFVMTRIDDIREGVAFLNLSYGLRVSVVMHDAAASRTTVLKEAADTKNYWLTSVGDGVVTVWEDSVKSEKDWGDEDKIEGREITVEIPATE